MAGCWQCSTKYFPCLHNALEALELCGLGVKVCKFPQRSLNAVHVYCSVRFATSDSMEVANSTQGGAIAHGLQQAKWNPAFINKAAQGEWQMLIRAASNLQFTRTGAFQQLPVIVFGYQTKFFTLYRPAFVAPHASVSLSV